MPNLFVIGAMKSGTTSLHRYLDLHPEISMSAIKEPDFFLRHLPETSAPRVTDRQRYLSLFQPGTKFRGESSVHYSIHPQAKGVPSAIASEAPDARFIYLVRDPVERVASLIRQMVSVGALDSRPPRDADDVRRWIGDLDDPVNLYVASGLYMTQLDQYLEYFPREALLVLDSDELAALRMRALSEVFEFLGIDPEDIQGSFDTRKNRADELTVKPAAWRWLKGRRRLRSVWRGLPDETRNRVATLVGRGFGQPVPPFEVDDELRRELEQIFRPEVERLREFTGRPFPGWSI